MSLEAGDWDVLGEDGQGCGPKTEHPADAGGPGSHPSFVPQCLVTNMGRLSKCSEPASSTLK